MDFLKNLGKGAGTQSTKVTPAKGKAVAKPAAKTAAKPAPKPVAKVTKSAGTKQTKGWLGGEGGSQTDLDKWYGECLLLLLSKITGP